MDGSTTWDWTKLPEYEHANAVEYYNFNKLLDLMKLANTYNITPEPLCCGDDPNDTYLQFKNAIEKGWITTN